MNTSGFKQFVKKWLLPPGVASMFSASVSSVDSTAIAPHIPGLTEMGNRLKNMHTGEDCFILGAGSSISKQDLRKLIGKNVISVSNTYVHPLYAQIKPQYHVLPSIFSGHGRVHSEEKFIEWMRDMDKNLGSAEIFLHHGDKKVIEENRLFPGRKCHWVEYAPWNEDFNTPIEFGNIPNIWSVSELALTVAVHMGYSRIYILGFDHDWFNGPLNYFFDMKKEHIIQPTVEKVAYADSEYQMRRHAYIFKKYKYLYSLKKNIYNANADMLSYVDVFPKVDYNSLF